MRGATLDVLFDLVRFGRTPLRVVPNVAARGASRCLPGDRRARQQFGQLSVDLLTLSDEVLRSRDLLVNRLELLRRIRCGAQVRLDEGTLIVREHPVPVKILPLTYDLRVQDASPPSGLRGLAIKGAELLGLHLKRGERAGERKVVPPAPMTPVVPGPERVVDLRVAIDGVF